jgi:predicted ester cyclase
MTDDPTKSETDKQVARAFDESYLDGDLDRSWEEYIAPDLINHAFGGTADRDAWLKADKELVAALSGLSLQIFDQVAEGDKVTTRYAFTGKQTAAFSGIPPTGATATLTITAIDRISAGKIAEHWTEADIAGFLAQLTPAP